jgi:CDP-diacylglycerol--glycerol-3-phosphate 3-phosphatidyltransferase
VAELVFLSDKNRARYFRLVTPIGNLLGRMGVHPNVLSVLGLLLSLVAAILFGNGLFFWAAWVVVLAGICDTLDGQIARQTKKTTRFGSFFDSTLDRYADMLLLIGLAYYFSGGRTFIAFQGGQGQASPWTVILILVAIVGAFMVSYTKARAEGLGIECRIGLMQRPERMVLLIIGSLLGAIPTIGPLLLKCALLLMAVFTNLTAIRRILHVRTVLMRESQGR